MLAGVQSASQTDPPLAGKSGVGGWMRGGVRVRLQPGEGGHRTLQCAADRRPPGSYTDHCKIWRS